MISLSLLALCEFASFFGSEDIGIECAACGGKADPIALLAGVSATCKRYPLFLDMVLRGGVIWRCTTGKEPPSLGMGNWTGAIHILVLGNILGHRLERRNNDGLVVRLASVTVDVPRYNLGFVLVHVGMCIID